MESILIKVKLIFTCRIHVLLTLAISIICTSIHAQDSLRFEQALEEPADTLSRIALKTNYTSDGMTLRWAPNKASDWIDLNREGYVILRYLMDREGMVIEGTEERFIIKPWTFEQFQPYATSDRDFVLAAAECLYGDWESVKVKGLNMQGRYQELTNKYGIALLAADLDTLAANALGLRYVDKGVEPDRLYLYRVSAADTSSAVESGYTLAMSRVIEMSRPLIDHIAEDEGYINVKWLREDHEPHFSAFHIEASEDGINFKRLTEVPFVGGVSEEYPSPYFSFKHKVNNYQPHFYRIIGLTHFGEVSQPSESVLGQARDRTPPSAPINLRVACDAVSNTVNIQWDPVEAPDMVGYHVLRSGRFDGEYQYLTEKNKPLSESGYQELSPDNRRIFYYKIASADTAGNMSFSRILQAAFRDTVAPASPRGLSGSIDSAGIVTLHWNKGTESDLRGYYVYMANQEDHFFTNMTGRPVIDTVWRDTITLKTFTTDIYYRVSAVDFHSHFSEWTEPLKLSKPDTIRPFPPSFTAYRVEESHILLQMSPSRSEDVSSHSLFKKSARNEEWVEITGFDISEGNYIDDDVNPGVTYFYRIVALDKAGNSSLKSPEINIKFIDRSRPEPPVITQCQEVEGAVIIAWDGGDQEEDFILYRSQDGGPYVTIARLDGKFNYRDNALPESRTYAYKLKSVWGDGRKSDFSLPAEPQVK